MYKYFLKIFFKKNSPHSFNFSILFPFIGTAISTLSIVVIYCVMTTLEVAVKDTIISVSGGATIKYSHLNNDNYEQIIDNIQKYLNSINVKNQKILSRESIISINGKNMFVKAIGLDDFDFIEKVFNLSLDDEFLNNGILIGEKLSRKLGYTQDGQSAILISPLDSGLSISARSFHVIDQKFTFQNPNTIEDISGENIYLSYNSAKELFTFAYPYIVVNQELSNDSIEDIENRFSNTTITTWSDENPLFFGAMKLEKFLYLTFGIIILLIVAFNIYGLVNLIILRKNNQLSLLLYLGSTKRHIARIFNYNILFIGLMGSIFGAVISILILESNILVDFGYLPAFINHINLYFPIIYISIAINLFTLYLSIKVSINKSIKKIGVLKSNAIAS